MMTGNEITRRNLLKTTGKYALAAPLLTKAVMLSGCARGVPHVRGDDLPKKIILQNGSVFMEGRYRKIDMEITKGRITSMTDRIDAVEDNNTRVMDCTDMYISPGWVDLHCHIGTKIGIGPGLLGPQMGVTALVEAGTYGPETFHNFLRNYYTEESIPIYVFLNVRKKGIRASDVMFKSVPGVEDVEGARRLVMEYPDIIRGLKVRLDSSNTSSAHPAHLAEVTAELGAELSMPVMYHLGKPEPSIIDFLKISKPGDIITHIFRETDNAVLLPSGAARPEALEAKSGGVIFDVGHGFASFWFDTAQKALDHDFTDFTISSDLWFLPSRSKALTFANVASKFLILGLSIEDITEKISCRPREILQIPSQIRVNEAIDLTIFDVPDGEYKYKDSDGQEMKYSKRIMPRYTIVRGEIIQSGERDQSLFG